MVGKANEHKPRLDEMVGEAVNVLRNSESKGKVVRIQSPWLRLTGRLDELTKQEDAEAKAAIVYHVAMHYSPTPIEAVATIGEALYHARGKKPFLSKQAYRQLQDMPSAIRAEGYRRIRLDLEELSIGTRKAKTVQGVRVFYTIYGPGLYTHKSQYNDVLRMLREIS